MMEGRRARLESNKNWSGLPLESREEDRGSGDVDVRQGELAYKREPFVLGSL